jgi:hypothetical protein
VVGVADTVAAVQEGRAATVLMSSGMEATHEGLPLAAWLSGRASGVLRRQPMGVQGGLHADGQQQGQTEHGQVQVILVGVDTAGGAGKQFLHGLEGVGAFLRATIRSDTCTPESSKQEKGELPGGDDDCSSSDRGMSSDDGTDSFDI